MAVGTPYGRFAYGKGPYARASGRPYGVGPYGTGHYERFVSNTFDVAGASSIHFAAIAPAAWTLQFDAITSIVFGAFTWGPEIEMHPWAITEIVLSTWTHADWAWDAWAPCEAGDWPLTAPCETGTWAAPAACTTGTWTLTRLV